MKVLRQLKKRFILLSICIMLLVPMTVYGMNAHMVVIDGSFVSFNGNGIGAGGADSVYCRQHHVGYYDCGHYSTMDKISSTVNGWRCSACGYGGTRIGAYALTTTFSSTGSAYYFNSSSINNYATTNERKFIGFISSSSDYYNAVPVYDNSGNVSYYTYGSGGSKINLIAGTNYLLNNTYYPKGTFGNARACFQIPTYNIIFDAAGGTYSDGSSTKTGTFDTVSKTNLGSYIPTLEGYTFLGYKTVLQSGSWSTYDHSDWELTTTGTKPVAVEDTSKRRTYTVNSNLATQGKTTDLLEYYAKITSDETTVANPDKITVTSKKTIESILSETRSGSANSVAPYGVQETPYYVWHWNPAYGSNNYGKAVETPNRYGYFINSFIKNGVCVNVKSVDMDDDGNLVIEPISYNEPVYYSDGTTLTILEYKTTMVASDEATLKCNMVDAATSINPLGTGKSVIKMTAVWQRNLVDYKVKFEANKPVLAQSEVRGMATDEMNNYGGNCYFWNKNNIAYEDGSYGVAYFEPSLTGYKFLGWYTKNGYDENGNDLGDTAWGTKVTADTINEGETDVLYARWEDATSLLLEGGSTSKIYYSDTLTDEPENMEWNQSGIDLTYYVSDNGSGIKRITISEFIDGVEKVLIDDSEWDIDGSSFNNRTSTTFKYETDDSVEGTHIYQITAYDHAGNYTKSPYIWAKIDTTNPTVSSFKINQTKITDLGYNQSSLATTIGNTDGIDVDASKLASVITNLETNMITNIEANISDFDATGGKSGSSAIKKVEIVITGNNGDLTLSTDTSDSTHKITWSGTTTNNEGIVSGIASWSGNLYTDAALSTSSMLKYQVKVTDKSGRTVTSTPTYLKHQSVQNGWDTDNYDAIATIIRNDSFNEAFNGTYITKDATKSASTLWEQVGTLLGTNYASYDEFFKDQYNFFRFGEYATVAVLTYGNVDAVSTNFNTSTINMEDIRTEIFDSYGIESLPSLNRQISINNTINTAATNWNTLGYQYDSTSTTPEISWTTAYHNGGASVVMYNTRFPLTAKSAVTTGMKDFEINVTKGTNGLSFFANYNFGSLNTPSASSSTSEATDSGISVGGIEDDIHIRISTNHTNGNLEYK